MKIVAIILVALGSLNLLAQNSRITRLEKNKSKAKSQGPSIKSSEDRILKKILENNKKMAKLLKKRSNIPNIWERRKTIETASVFRGKLLNSINSTNLASPILVQANEGQGLKVNTKFSCQGVTKFKRVFTLCNKMLSPDREQVIQAQALNLDGTSGLVGQYDDAKESLISGALIDNFSEGILKVAQKGLKNELYQGAIELGKTATEHYSNDLKSKEPIVTVQAGTSVLIYFMEKLNEN